MASVSVIIPTYNHGAFISETLESVFAQTFKDYEVIIVNDGSPDDTSAVLAPYIEAGRIRYVEQENSGPAAARNRGLMEANGQFIAFLDDDDLWPADKLEHQIGIMLRTNHAIVGGIAGLIEHGICGCPPDSQQVETIDMLSAFSSTPFYSPGQVVFRRSALEKVGGFDAGIWGADDYDIYVRISMIGSIVRVARCGLYYRVHSGNASRALVQMFWNLLASVKKNSAHVPPQFMRVARRAGYIWAFRYAGRKAISLSIQGPQRNLAAGARIFLSLFFASIRDPGLGARIGLDLIPVQIRDKFRGLLRSRA